MFLFLVVLLYKGPGGRKAAPQGLQNLPGPHILGVHSLSAKPPEIHRNHWKALRIFGKALEIIGNPWKALESVRNSWKALEILAKPSKSLNIPGKPHKKP